MRVTYIEPVLFIYTLTLFFNIPLEKQLVYRKVCLNNYNQTFCQSLLHHHHLNGTNTTAEENVVQAESAKWEMLCNLARLVPTLFSTLHLGAWSDSVGRKKVIFVAVIGESVNAIGYFLNVWYFSAPLPFLFVGSIVTGFCGNFAAIMMGVLSYIGDVTSADTRTTRLVFLDGLAFLASVIASVSGGMILQKLGSFLYIYALDMCLYILILIYLCFVQESHTPGTQVRFKDIFCGNKFGKYSSLFKQEGNRARRLIFGLLVGCFCTLFFCTTGIDNVLVNYLLHSPLTFMPSGIGLVLASESTVKFAGALIITLVFVRKLNFRDSSLILMCALAVAGYALSLGFSRHNWAIFVSTLWGLGVSSGVATCRSGLSKMVALEDLGKLNSVVCILQNLCLLLSGVVFNNLYQHTVHISPSITLFVISGFAACFPLGLSLALKWFERKLEAPVLDVIKAY